MYFQARVFDFFLTQMRHRSSVASATSSSCNASLEGVDTCMTDVQFRESGIQRLPLILVSPGMRWTLCLHIDDFSEDEDVPNPWIIQDMADPPDYKQHFAFDDDQVRTAYVRQNPLKGVIGELRVIRIEADVELAKEYSLSWILNRCELDENGQIVNIDILPPYCTSPAKPPPNLLTYLALSNQGLRLIESSGFIGKAHEVLNSNRSLDLRSYLWSIGHIASSEIGAMFLARNQLLQRKAI